MRLVILFYLFIGSVLPQEPPKTLSLRPEQVALAGLAAKSEGDGREMPLFALGSTLTTAQRQWIFDTLELMCQFGSKTIRLNDPKLKDTTEFDTLTKSATELAVKLKPREAELHEHKLPLPETAEKKPRFDYAVILAYRKVGREPCTAR